MLNLPPHRRKQLHELPPVLRQTIHYLPGIKNILIVLIAILNVILVVVLVPVRFLLFPQPLPRPAVVLVVVVLQIGLLHVVTLENGLPLSGAQVVGGRFVTAVCHSAKIIYTRFRKVQI